MYAYIYGYYNAQYRFIVHNIILYVLMDTVRIAGHDKKYVIYNIYITYYTRSGRVHAAICRRDWCPRSSALYIAHPFRTAAPTRQYIIQRAHTQYHYVHYNITSKIYTARYVYAVVAACGAHLDTNDWTPRTRNGISCARCDNSKTESTCSTVHCAHTIMCALVMGKFGIRQSLKNRIFEIRNLKSGFWILKYDLVLFYNKYTVL